MANELRDRMTLAASVVAGDPRMSRAARDAAADVMLETDLIACASSMVTLIITLEDARNAADALAKQAREALTEALEATTGRVKAGIHTASTSNGRQSVAITDDAAIPAEFMRQPEPQPDKAAILAAMKEGRNVPGAVLRNGAPTLTIRVNNTDMKGHAA